MKKKDVYNFDILLIEYDIMLTVGLKLLVGRILEEG